MGVQGQAAFEGDQKGLPLRPYLLDPLALKLFQSRQVGGTKTRPLAFQKLKTNGLGVNFRTFRRGF